MLCLTLNKIRRISHSKCKIQRLAKYHNSMHVIAMTFRKSFVSIFFWTKIAKIHFNSFCLLLNGQNRRNMLNVCGIIHSVVNRQHYFLQKAHWKFMAFLSARNMILQRMLWVVASRRTHSSHWREMHETRANIILFKTGALSFQEKWCLKVWCMAWRWQMTWCWSQICFIQNAWLQWPSAGGAYCDRCDSRNKSLPDDNNQILCLPFLAKNHTMKMLHDLTQVGRLFTWNAVAFQ